MSLWESQALFGGEWHMVENVRKSALLMSDCCCLVTYAAATQYVFDMRK